MKAPSSEPKEDFEMKRFFVFTLIALFATACLLVVNLNADNPTDDDYGTVLDNVFVEAYAATYWSAPYASSHMDGYVGNNGGHAVKYYGDFATNLSGPGWRRLPKTRAYSDWLAIGERWTGNYNASFHLPNPRTGNWTIWASSDVTVKSDLNGDGFIDGSEVATKNAYADTDFEIE